MASQVRVVDCRVFEAVKNSEEFVEVCACVVVGTDLAGTIALVSLPRRGAEHHSGIAAKRVDHQAVGTAGAVQKVEC